VKTTEALEPISNLIKHVDDIGAKIFMEMVYVVTAGYD